MKKNGQRVIDFLQSLDYSINFIFAILILSEITILNEKKDYKYLAEIVASLLLYHKSPTFLNGAPSHKIFIGSPGVGKTSTLVKIATDSYIEKSLKVEFIAIDSVIKSHLKLKKLSSILDVPFSLIGNRQCHNSDVMFYDTGNETLASKDKVDWGLVNSISSNKEIFLCLNSRYSLDNISANIDSYAQYNYTTVILTKVDSVSNLGPHFSLLYEKKISLAYITDGEDIPSDIIIANKSNLKDLLFKQWQDILPREL